MGTSTAYSGPSGNTPLIPSWLEPDNISDPSPNESPAEQPPTEIPKAPSDRPALTLSADPNRFVSVRTNLSKFARSGGTDRASMGRAISGYVTKSSGGARKAAMRMGASRKAGAALYGFLSSVQANGVSETLRNLNLGSLAGRPINEIFLGLVDHICPDGGTVDEGIAREAFIESIIQMEAQGITDLDALTPDQIQTVFEMFATNAIEARICNDIGTKAIIMPANAQAAIMLQEQLRDFIRNAVSDAVAKSLEEKPELSKNQVQTFVDSVYERSFRILQILGDAEADL